MGNRNPCLGGRFCALKILRNVSQSLFLGPGANLSGIPDALFPVRHPTWSPLTDDRMEAFAGAVIGNHRIPLRCLHREHWHSIDRGKLFHPC